MKGFYLLTLLFCFSIRLMGQERTGELENITVTTSLLAQQQKETGRNIISIKGEVFGQLPVYSVDDLLRYLPGIEVQQRGPQGAQADITLRGGIFQQVLVIIDGVKLNDPLTGHFSGYIPINPSEIERIEILKGAASAIYGSEAVGGVVHIITKTFNPSKTNSRNTVRGRIVAGEYNLLNAEAYFRWTKNKSTVSGGVLTNNAEGQALRGTNGFFHLTTANIAFSRKFKNDLTISFRTAADFRKFNAQNFYTTFASDTANETVTSWWNQLNLNKKTRNGVLNFDAAYKTLIDKYTFRPTSIPNDNEQY